MYLVAVAVLHIVLNVVVHLNLTIRQFTLTGADVRSVRTLH